jgi:hypothetical protein
MGIAYAFIIVPPLILAALIVWLYRKGELRWSETVACLAILAILWAILWPVIFNHSIHAERDAVNRDRIQHGLEPYHFE